MLGLDSNGLDLEPGKDIGFTPLYCPLGHAALLQLAWREVPVLGSSADYLSALVQAARDFGLDVPAEDDLKKRLGL